MEEGSKILGGLSLYQFPASKISFSDGRYVLLGVSLGVSLGISLGVPLGIWLGVLQGVAASQKTVFLSDFDPIWWPKWTKKAVFSVFLK